MLLPLPWLISAASEVSVQEGTFVAIFASSGLKVSACLSLVLWMCRHISVCPLLLTIATGAKLIEPIPELVADPTRLLLLQLHALAEHSVRVK